MQNRNSFLIHRLGIHIYNLFVILSFLFVGITSDLWSMEDGKNQDKKREFMRAVLNNEPWAVKLQKDIAYASQNEAILAYHQEQEKKTGRSWNQYSIDQEAHLDLVGAREEKRATIWDHPEASDVLRKEIQKHNDNFLNP